MSATAFRVTAVLAAVSANLILISCSETSTAPKVGTPAFSWAAAKETYTAGDYAKTIEHLDKVLTSDNEFSAKALPWQLVLTAGMSRGYSELANSFEAGGRANRAKVTDFRRETNLDRTNASRLALQFAEYFGRLQKNKDDYVPLAFPYPSGLYTPVMALTKISNGTLLSPGEMENAQKRALERGVLVTLCNAVGAPDDPAKAQDVLKTPDARVARATFVMAMAAAMHEQSQLYSRTKLDDPEKMKILCSRAQDALKSIPETKQTKDLNSKIEKTLKGIKST